MSAAGPPLTRLLSATACVSPFHSQRTKGVGGPPGAHSSLSFPAAAAALTAGGQPGWAGAGAPYLPSPPPLPRHCGSLRHDGLVRGGGAGGAAGATADAVDFLSSPRALYERVQFTPSALPRLYLLVTAGAVYARAAGAPVAAVLRDLVHMAGAVQHPQRGLFLRAYLAQSMRDRLPNAPAGAVCRRTLGGHPRTIFPRRCSFDQGPPCSPRPFSVPF